VQACRLQRDCGSYVFMPEIGWAKGVPTGTVVQWAQGQPKGGGKDVFVHISAVGPSGLSGLNEGQAVEYEEMSGRGKK
jgi:cold shock CspA family protein